MGKSSGTPAEYDLPEGPFGQGSLLIYGGGGHGKCVIDLLRRVGDFEIIGIVDDGIQVGSQVMGCKVLGDERVLRPLYGKGVHQALNAVGGIGDVRVRISIFRKLMEVGFSFPTIAHPSSVVEPSVSLGDGVQVLPQSYLGTETKIGFGVIVNNGVVVSHDCEVGDYAGLAPGVILAGGVSVGEGAQLGLGVTANLNVRIGEYAQVGNSAVIKSDVPDGEVVHAGQVWPPRN